MLLVSDRGNVQRKCTFDISKNYVDRCIKYKKDIDNCNLPVCVEKGAEGTSTNGNHVTSIQTIQALATYKFQLRYNIDKSN